MPLNPVGTNRSWVLGTHCMQRRTKRRGLLLRAPILQILLSANDTHSPWTHKLRGPNMTRNGKWKTYAQDSAKLLGSGGTSWVFPRRPLPICASLTEPTSAGLSEESETWLSSTSRRLRER